MSNRPDLSDFLCFSVYSAGSAFTKIYRPLLDALGLTYPQYLVLAALWEADGQTVGQIGERLFLESSTLSPVLKRLEAAGHVERRRAQADERVVQVFLTAQGSELGRRAQSIPGCIVEASGMELDELRTLKAALERLRDALLAAAQTSRPASTHPASPR